MKPTLWLLLLWGVLSLIPCGGNAQVVLIDSKTMPTENSYDSALGDYTDSLTIYSLIDTTGPLESFVMELKCTRLSEPLWTVRMSFVDSAGTMVFHPIATLDLEPGDFNLDGELSLGDIMRIIDVLFITGH